MHAAMIKGKHNRVCHACKSVKDGLIVHEHVVRARASPRCPAVRVPTRVANPWGDFMWYHVDMLVNCAQLGVPTESRCPRRGSVCRYAIHCHSLMHASVLGGVTGKGALSGMAPPQPRLKSTHGCNRTYIVWGHRIAAQEPAPPCIHAGPRSLHPLPRGWRPRRRTGAPTGV